MSLAPGDPMSPDWVPGPYDHWRGVIEINFQDGLTPEGKALIEAAERRAAAKRAARGTPADSAPPPEAGMT
ncbi:MAG: hypothetical protein K2X82_29500, partial [Gemmataceae bacterium]|nr:hypothetical protein [Gemmataceae bacterium]